MEKASPVVDVFEEAANRSGYGGLGTKSVFEIEQFCEYLDDSWDGVSSSGFFDLRIIFHQNLKLCYEGMVLFTCPTRAVTAGKVTWWNLITKYVGVFIHRRYLPLITETSDDFI